MVIGQSAARRRGLHVPYSRAGQSSILGCFPGFHGCRLIAMVIKIDAEWVGIKGSRWELIRQVVEGAFRWRSEVEVTHPLDCECVECELARAVDALSYE